MKYGVVGNRDGWTKDQVFNGLNKVGITFNDTIISGGARGVDTFTQDYAKMIGATLIICYPNPNLPIPKRFFERNGRIALLGEDGLIAFDKKEYSGTKNTINQAKALKRRIIEFDGRGCW